MAAPATGLIAESPTGPRQKNDAIVGIIKKKTRVKDKDSTELLILIDIRRLVENEEPVTLPSMEPAEA